MAADPASARLMRRWSRAVGVGLVGLLAWTAAGMGPVFGWRAPWVLWWLGLALAIGGAGVAAAVMVRLRRLDDGRAHDET